MQWTFFKALIRSSEYLNNRQDLGRGAIYNCTNGVVFLGTPHRGSDQTGFADIVSRIAKVAWRQPSHHLVRNLEVDSDVLERQRKSFASISEKNVSRMFVRRATDRHWRGKLLTVLSGSLLTSA